MPAPLSHYLIPSHRPSIKSHVSVCGHRASLHSQALISSCFLKAFWRIRDTNEVYFFWRCRDTGYIYNETGVCWILFWCLCLTKRKEKEAHSCQKPPTSGLYTVWFTPPPPPLKPLYANFVTLSKSTICSWQKPQRTMCAYLCNASSFRQNLSMAAKELDLTESANIENCICTFLCHFMKVYWPKRTAKLLPLYIQSCGHTKNKQTVHQS